MARLSQFVSLGLALSALPATLAGPSCAKKNFQAADCVSKCQSRWGWPGAMMNTDPWGSVMKKTEATEWASVIAEACGVSVPSTSASSTASATESVIPSAAAAAGAIPTIQSSSVASVASSTLATPSSSSSQAPSSSSSASSSSSKIVSSSSVPPPSTTAASLQTQGFVASTRSRFVTSTIARPTTSSPAVQQQQPAPSSTKASSSKEQQPTSSAAPANTPAPSSGGSSSSSESSSGTSSADIQAYLEAHNSVRAQHGAAPLTWSDTAASKAQQWANNCVFQHSGGTLGPFGENLAAGTGSSYGIAAAIKSWTDEVSQYNPSNPQASHFTQVVWKGTTQVGCAVQTCSGIFAASFGPAKFFVCEYSPQGNIIGQFAQNVQV